MSKIDGLTMKTSNSSGQNHQVMSASSMERTGAVMIAMNSGRLSGRSATAKQTTHTIGTTAAKSCGSSQRLGNSGTTVIRWF